MTNPREMTDEQLCEAISKVREPKPETPIQANFNEYSDGLSWFGNPFNMISYWNPVDWLTWEYNGKLLEEIIERFEVRLMSDASTNYIAVLNHGSYIYSNDGYSLQRIIAEAYLRLSK